MKNRKTIFIILGGLFLLGLFQSCGPSAEEQRLNKELNELKSIYKQDSLDLRHLQSEMSTINNQLNRITLLDMELHQKGELSKMDALQKIAQIENILEKSDAQVHGLEMQLKESNPSIAGLGTSLFVYDKKEEINRRREYIGNLKREVQNLKSQNVTLQKKVHQKDDEIVERNYTINQKDFELKEMSQNAKTTKEELVSLKKTYKDYKNSMDLKIGAIHFQEGLALLKSVQNVKASHRKEQVKRAYDQFLLSKSFNYPDAQYQINVIKTQKEYSKYLEK